MHARNVIRNLPADGARRLAGLPRMGLLSLVFVAGCASQPENDSSSERTATRDTTHALRQRIVHYESIRSFGGDTLPNATRHADPRVRRAAAVALGRIQDGAALEFVLPLLEDSDSTVVTRAAWAIRQLRGLDESQRHAVQSALTLKLDLEKRDRLWIFLEALRPHAGPASIDPVGKWIAGGLLAGMGSQARPPLVEGMAALVLGELNTPHARRTLSLVGELLNREQSAAWRIARAMSLHPDSLFLRSLRSLTTHDHPYARAAGARALGVHVDTRSIDLLYPLLSDFDWEVRASALRALGDIGDAEARSFCAAMTGDSHALVREAALLALEKLGAGEQVRFAEEMLHDPIPGVRLTALRVVADTRGAEARDAWESAREDRVDFVRSEALRSVFDVMQADEATSVLLHLMQSMSVRERSTAAATFGAGADSIPGLRRTEVRMALEKALEDADFVVASVAAQSLGEFGDRAAVGALVEAYRRRDGDHNDVDVRWAAVGALYELAENRSGAEASGLESFFEMASADSDPRVAHDARRGLARVRSEDEPSSPTPRAQPPGPDPTALPPIDLGRVRVRLVTRHGEAIIELHGDEYPRTVGSFLTHVDDGFYDDGVFHRVVPAFVVQGGCPRGDGWGDAGELLPCEYGDLRYDREGIVGMAHAGRDTGGSQFFITHLPVPRLDGRYTAFGRVVEGMETVDSIVRGDHFRIERVAAP